MRHKTITAVISAALLATPLFAGALRLMVADPQTSPEARAKHAVVMVQTTACRDPEKTVVSATAEGLVAGKRRTLPLQVMRFSPSGAYGVARQWPAEGIWTVRVVATNPEYKDYATGVVIPVDQDTWSKAGAKEFYRAPTEEDVNLALKARLE